ncbi:mucin-5AC-like [Bufo bufo]|uniref:mucin-5AC-like n=1 Tax=Bufo bufo TaxID=8384 RepID=UPI001ABE6112|nr:mucin-5AC-like [Bufo bufo]
MGTNRRLLISIGGFLILLTCIHAQGQNISEEDWDSVEQDYGEMNVDNDYSGEIQQTVGEDDEDIQQTVGEDDKDIQQQSNGNPSRVNIMTSPPPVYRNQNPSHNINICSTFGNCHYKTFDGDIYHFPGHCSYVLVRQCKNNYEEFFVAITRQAKNNVPVITAIHMTIGGVDISFFEKTVVVNQENVEKLPYSVGGIEISRDGNHIRTQSHTGIDILWNEEDSITVQLSMIYANQTCGLCGDYNGIPIYNEFLLNGAHLTNLQYGSLQKYNPPEEKCEETIQEEETTCPQSKHLCTSVLTGTAFQECNKIVEVQKYIELCEQDICRCKGNSTGFCLCNIFSEYSRQCTHAGGKPKNWRTSKICPPRCAFNLQYRECDTPCKDTCSNPEHSLTCKEHCTFGCFCPAGMVFDDIRKTGCIQKEACPCTHNGDVYPSGKGYSEKCQDCTCMGGKWSCVKKACNGVCSIEGGFHINTFDLTSYNLHGDCTYTLSKICDSSLFSILVELSKCGHTDTQTCLKSISLNMNGGKEMIFIKKCGSVYINSVYTQLPVSTASVTCFMPTSFYMIIQTNMGLQMKIQMVPSLQVYVSIDPKYMGKTCGLCGNFNGIQADDFKSPAGVIEGSGASFSTFWKSQLDCPNVKNNFEDPCALISQNEQYASHHCDLLLASDGPFASCHKTVDPGSFHKNCMFDACNCENKEDCMCSALSSYVNACSREGIDLRGWRSNICHSYTTTCQPGHVYSYTVSTCMPSCRSLSEPDITCKYDIGTVDGCICEDGTYRDDSGGCVVPALCSCYYKGTAMSPGEVLHEGGSMCTCTNGKMDCVGVNPVEQKVCEHPMVYFDCDNATVGTKGSECQKSCSTFDTDCYSSGCVSGCVCPEGLVHDDERNVCIAEDDCPCTLNNDYYAPGETVQVKCNTCTCKQRKWECTTNTCLGTCGTYGDGNYYTFDNRRYRFNGNCWYTLAQDYCSNDPSEGTFRVLTENNLCGSKGTTCSKSLRIIIGKIEMQLAEQKFDVVRKDTGPHVSFKVRQMGLYMVFESANGLVVIWDRRNIVMVKLDPKFEGKVCGLCGNFDGNAANDYITRSQSTVGDVLEYANSWKLSQRCPDAVDITDTCASNPYRKAWSQKHCSIITSGVFASCHGLVDPVKYHEACVNDACACDSGGDCDCFCTAVAAYAQACSEAGQCIKWRSPNICPVFCDFYNQQGHCEWHYKACGAPCLKTCMNPTGACFNKLIGLEGCYPTCPEDRPFFDEESMRCVASCNCYDEYAEEYKPGEKMPGPTRCSVCTCTKNGIECSKSTACCKYEGKEYMPGDIVYYTADGIGGCITATCLEDSTVEKKIGICQTTAAPSTTFNFSASTSTEESSTSHEGSATSSTTSEALTTSSEVSPTACVEAHECTWSEWYDVSKPENSEGDFETFENIESQGHKVCKNPRKVECRAKEYPNYALKDLGQNVTCSRKNGLVCNNSANPPLCHNYEMRTECCKYRECTTTSAPTSVEHSSTNTEQTSAPTSSSVEIKTQSPTTKEHPTSLPVQATSQTPISTSAATSGTSESSETVTISSETTSETSTTKGSTSSAIVSTSSKSTPQKTQSTTSTGSSETSSPVTEKTLSSKETPKTSAPSPTTSCVYKMECRWTQWYDNNKPNTKSDGGDTESVDDVKSRGGQICTMHEVENKMECRAVDNKGLAIANNNQKYSCDKNSGLICSNREQTNKTKCSNYQFRMECCEKVCEPVQTPKVTTTEITEPKSTSGETTTQGTTGQGSEPSQVSTRPSSSAPSTPLLTEEPTTSHEVIPSPATLCVYKMQCRWTGWFDNNKPSKKSDGGDTESIADLKSKGKEVCNGTEVVHKIECGALDNKGVPIMNNSQNFSCSQKDGVICLNRDQINKGKCENYGMRVLCCEEVCEPVPTPAISTIQTSEPTTISSATTQPTPGSTSMSSTEIPKISTPSEGTSTPLTSSTVITSSTSTTATCIPKRDCRWTHWYDLNRPTQQSDGGERESPEYIKSKGHEICEVHEFPGNIECAAIDLAGEMIADNHQILTCDMETGLSCNNTDQKNNETCKNLKMRVQCCVSYCEPVVASTRPSPVGTKSPSPTTSSITEPTLSSPKDCENERALECRWTQWFNENQPSTEITGGENENSDKLTSAGFEVCKPNEIKNKIECKERQNSSIESGQNLAQKTTCNVKEGFSCKNQDQSEGNCRDNSIRFECCSEKFVKSCGESTTPSPTEGTSVPTTISITKSSSETPSETPSTSVTATKRPDTSSDITPGSSTKEPSSPSLSSTGVV